MIKYTYKDTEGKESTNECDWEELFQRLKEQKHYIHEFKLFGDNMDLIDPEDIGIISIDLDGYIITDIKDLVSKLAF
jgi:hypothetical protein